MKRGGLELTLFRKSISEITLEDVRAIINSNRQEDVEVEFKAELAVKGGREKRSDPWILGQGEIGDEAKRDLTKEMIAFANTQGGTLVLGITEDGERRASAVVSMPKCRELASRLGDSIMAICDPPLIALETVGIPVEGDAGVVILRVPPSPRAPHCDRASRYCYRRRNDSSEPMTMREIQELTLERSRRFENVTKRLHDGEGLNYPYTWLGIDGEDGKHGPFAERMSLGVVMRWQRICSVRGVAVPIEPVSLDDLTNSTVYHLPAIPLVELTAERQVKHVWQAHARRWSPMLRGIRHIEINGSEQKSEQIVSRDGTFSIGWRGPSTIHQQDPSRSGIESSKFLDVFANLIVSTHLLRVRLKRPDLEYALLFEWRIEDGVEIISEKMRRSSDPIRCIEPYNQTADYLLPRIDEFSRLFSEIERDFWNSCGTKEYEPLRYDFERSVNQIG